MQLQLKLMFIAFVALIALLQCGKAYRIPSVSQNSTPRATNATKPATAKVNATLALANSSNSSIFRTQAVANASQPSAASATLHASTDSSSSESSKPVLQHVARKKRETDAVMPFSFHILHQPCDFEMSGRGKMLDFMQNHCIWTFNNRFQHSGLYRAYKNYELEAFFFGQYHERLMRYEIDPHTWDYGDNVLNP